MESRNAAERVPGVSALAKAFERLARYRLRGIPVGLLALVPVVREWSAPPEAGPARGDGPIIDV